MDVVSSNSDAEIARNDALQGLRWRLRELAANLMRIARGGGKPHGVGEQVYAVLEGYRAYHAAAGYYPGNDEIADAVSIAHPEGYLSGLNDLSVDEVRAEQQIVRGALQVAASRLMGPRTQETTGGHDMIEGKIGRAHVCTPVTIAQLVCRLLLEK